MTEMVAPKISICIPVYNGELFLPKAVESTLRQSYSDFEVIIVDNASTDGTARWAADMAAGHSKIRLFKNDRNIGLAGNFNRCLDYAQGTYIKFLMADDLLLPGCLEQMAIGLNTCKSVTLVAIGRLIIDEHGRELAINRYSNTDVLVPGKQAITECLFGSHYIGEPTAVMFRKSDLTGKFREDLPQVLDMDMWFRLLERGDLLYMGEPLCAIRHHAGQMTHANTKSGESIEDSLKLFEAYSHKTYINPSLRLVAQHQVHIAYRVWKSRKYITSEKKKLVLGRYGSTLAYRLMPVGSFLLNFKRRIFASLKRRLRSKSECRR